MLPGRPDSLRPQLIFVVLCLIASALISAALFTHNHQQSLERHKRDYGHALANLAARQAVDATLNHDLVSMQVILTDVAQNAGVVGATIHDVENQLLVQSGHKPGSNTLRDGPQRSYTAPITLHDSVAGYVTVTLSLHAGLSTGNNFYWQLGFGVVLLLGLAALVLSTWWRERDTDQPGQTGGQDDALQAAEAEFSQEPATTVLLNLQIHNLAQLRGQLNRLTLQSLLQRFEQQLQGVLTLYSGNLLSFDDSRLCLQFSGYNAQDCSFRALCSAQLLLSLSARCSGSQLLLSASVTTPTEIREAEPLLQQLLDGSDDESKASTVPSQASRQVYISPELLSPELEKQAQYTPLQDFEGARLDQIKPPYSDLLAKQELQLMAL